MANKRSQQKTSRTTVMKRGEGGTAIEQAIVKQKIKGKKMS